jgi:hypothetical protein
MGRLKYLSSIIRKGIDWKSANLYPVKSVLSLIRIELFTYSRKGVWFSG